MGRDGSSRFSKKPTCNPPRPSPHGHIKFQHVLAKKKPETGLDRVGWGVWVGAGPQFFAQSYSLVPTLHYYFKEIK
jgi:hypothetical protein